MDGIRQISSASNDFYKLVKKLIARRDCRRENGLFVAEGRRLVQDALICGMMPRALLLGDRLTRSGGSALEELYRPGCAVYGLSDRLIDSLGDTRTSQGVLGVFDLPAQEREDLSGEKKLFLSSLQDPGNVGTILRTAQALGVSRVLLTRDCPDLYSSKVLRASMGGVFRVKTTVVRDAGETVAALRAAGERVYAAALRADALEAGRVSFRGKVCVLIGNEGAGLPDEIVNGCDRAVMIPMPGKAQSLNAAMAAGILIWEMTKDGAPSSRQKDETD